MRKPNATVSDELSVNGMKVFTENEREVVNVEMKGDYYKSIDNEASLSNPLASGIQAKISRIRTTLGFASSSYP